MSIEAWVALATLVIGLATILWQLSATLTGLRSERSQMSVEIGLMQKAIAELRAALERLDAVPLHEQRITQLEKMLDYQQKQVATLWTKVFSLDKHTAVLRAVSEHDLSSALHDTEPPPGEED